MELVIFSVIVLLASVFLVSGAMRKDEHLLATSGAFFLILGCALIVSGLQFQTGAEKFKEDIDSNTTEVDVDYTYKDLDEATGLSFTTTGFSIIFLVTGLYLSVYSLILGDGRPGLFRNFFR